VPSLAFAVAALAVPDSLNPSLIIACVLLALGLVKIVLAAENVTSTIPCAAPAALTTRVSARVATCVEGVGFTPATSRAAYVALLPAPRRTACTGAGSPSAATRARRAPPRSDRRPRYRTRTWLGARSIRPRGRSLIRSARAWLCWWPSSRFGVIAAPGRSRPQGGASIAVERTRRSSSGRACPAGPADVVLSPSGPLGNPDEALDHNRFTRPPARARLRALRTRFAGAKRNACHPKRMIASRSQTATFA